MDFVSCENSNNNSNNMIIVIIILIIVIIIIAASERSERAATLIWPSRTAHLYIYLFPYSTFSWLAIFPFMNT